MVFSSIIFLFFFLPVFLITYYLSPRKAKNYIILFFSLFFYAWGAPWFIFYLIGSTLINHYLVTFMDKAKSKRSKNLWLALSVALTIGLLLYFKYANFFMENVNAVRGFFGSMPMEWKKILLPIGISFFSFQSLTYTVDVYRKEHAPLKNPLNYLLYIVMFPQLIAGPIVRFQWIADQFRYRKESMQGFVYGFIRFSIGLARKVLIADVIAVEVDKYMATDFASMNTATAWIVIIGYTVQLYFDFSGYSDMAIGLGRMMGFKFPENFNNPYIAESVTKFWRRWHMTFSDFMRDYLYIPLGGNRVNSQFRLYFNLWVVFLLSGLWHGASWNFVIYGAMHGTFMVIERLGFYKVLKRLPKAMSIFYTFMIVVLARVLFRLETFAEATAFYKALFTFDFGTISFSSNYWVAFILGLFFSFVCLFNFGQKWEKTVFFSNYNNLQLNLFFIGALALFIISVAYLSGSGFSPFIYFRF